MGRTCPFNALHDVDESIYFDHLVSCPDRVLLDPGLAVDSESMDVRCTIYDAKGDTSVPPYDDAVAFSQRENPDGFDLEVWSEHSGDGGVITSASCVSYRDPGREYDKALARAIQTDQSLLNLPCMKKKIAKAARVPRPVVYVENILIEEELRKERKKEKKERKEKEKKELRKKERKEKRENEKMEEKAKVKAEREKRKAEKEQKNIEREKRKAEKERNRDGAGKGEKRTKKKRKEGKERERENGGKG